MKRIDHNQRYRDCAVFCVMQCHKSPFRRVEWELLQQRYGDNWETYTHELMVKHILHGSVGYYYLDAAWEPLSNTEAIENIYKIYPRHNR